MLAHSAFRGRRPTEPSPRPPICLPSVHASIVLPLPQEEDERAVAAASRAVAAVAAALGRLRRAGAAAEAAADAADAAAARAAALQARLTAAMRGLVSAPCRQDAYVGPSRLDAAGMQQW